MASLRVVGADGTDTVIELRERKLQIGRSRDNDVVLADPEKGVSRTHAELRFENGRYVIVDLQSQNGTWVDGRRVERAEVPIGSEITIGDYRLTIQKDSAGASNPSAGATVLRPMPDSGDLRLREPEELSDHFPSEHPSTRSSRSGQPSTPHGRSGQGGATRSAHSGQPSTPYRGAVQAQTGPRERNVFVAATLVVAAVILFGTVAWLWGPGARQPSQASSAADSSASVPPAAVPAADTAPVAERPPVTSDAYPAKGNSSKRPAGESPKLQRVARKPGESAEAWRTRSEALETRYAYSKAALDRRDYAAAAGGFQAILLEEPGFLDAAQLLVQANAGLRATANSLFESGRRLDAAGDWVGALQKYEQAKQTYAAIIGVNDAIARARQKLHAAGAKAFEEAKQLEAAGKNAEAIKQYEKAVQWLPADDANRQAARARLEQLKRTQ